MASTVTNPIGILDSGVGGLSVLRHVRAQLPAEHLLYFADQANVPYGPRPAEEVCRFCHGITDFFLKRQAKLIVVACNTASAAALGYLRKTFPDVPFVGMEPAVKPGAGQTRNGKVGVLATVGTFKSERYTRLVEQYAREVEVWENPCIGLVQQIEARRLDTPDTEALLRHCLEPMLAAGVDTLVLGCTHYPFVMPLIQQIAGPEVLVIDPAPAVARQTGRVLEKLDLCKEEDLTQRREDARDAERVRGYTSGDAGVLVAQVGSLLGMSFPVRPVVWQGGVSVE
jgi:glutamate racemase